ncbi:GNAT family N-acetyltransferase [Chachezhania sediminis]|uniref:GNAT family N-acetyltransferase n=1 Tax=Chachezhania sediminis TaxID=2599291 RepID=UPI00131CF024|nr:GNAT family N-acetyltransferase [Chachezhania sediminis]
MTAITLRPLRDDDGLAAAQLFFDAVHHGTRDHYTETQRRAWAGDTPDLDLWRDRLKGVEGFAAEDAEGRLAGFMTIDRTGYIDLAFVRADIIGQGLGQRLYDSVEAQARAWGVTGLSVDASLKARPFFEARGFAVEKQQTVVRREVELTNFRMSRLL